MTVSIILEEAGELGICYSEGWGGEEWIRGLTQDLGGLKSALPIANNE